MLFKTSAMKMKIEYITACQYFYRFCSKAMNRSDNEETMQMNSKSFVPEMATNREKMEK